MPNESSKPLVWWVVPNVIGGMPMPWLHPDRREELGGKLDAWDDEMPQLYEEGVRAVVCLLNIPSDPLVYRKAGFGFHLMPVANGGVPDCTQTAGFISFMRDQTASRNPVAVHCEAGLGRTGTVIASWLIASGVPPAQAIQNVRDCQPAAIETAAQINYLTRLPEILRELEQGVPTAA